MDVTMLNYPGGMAVNVKEPVDEVVAKLNSVATGITVADQEDGVFEGHMILLTGPADDPVWVNAVEVLAVSKAVVAAPGLEVPNGSVPGMGRG